jgi:membrane protein required for colicin V production
LKTFTDAVIVALLLLYAASGFRRGFIRSLVDLLGGIAALIGAVIFSQQFADWVREFLGDSAPQWMNNTILTRVAAVLVLFLLFEGLIQTAASLLNHVFRLPGLRQLNALLGGVFGLGKGAVVVLLLCASLRTSLPSFSANQQWLKQAAFSQIYQSVSARNPVYDLLQSEFWSEVGNNAKQAI